MIALAAGACVMPSPVHADAAQATAVIILIPGVLELADRPWLVDRGPSNDGGELISLSADVADARGTGDGWTLIVTTSARAMLTILNVTTSCDSASSCTLPVTQPASLPTFAEAGPDTSTVLFRAHPLSGMGRQTLVITIDEVVDHSASAQDNVLTLSLVPDL